MFKKETDEFITMLQRIVALLRDLLLGIVILFTCVIIYYGGDPSNLNALDWLKLIGSAFLIIAGPIATFFLYKLFLSVLGYLSGWAETMAERQLERTVESEVDGETKKVSEIFPNLTSFIRGGLDVQKTVSSKLNEVTIYALPLLVLIYLVLVFRNVLRNYTP